MFRGDSPIGGVRASTWLTSGHSRIRYRVDLPEGIVIPFAYFENLCFPILMSFGVWRTFVTVDGRTFAACGKADILL